MKIKHLILTLLFLSLFSCQDKERAKESMAMDSAVEETYSEAGDSYKEATEETTANDSPRSFSQPTNNQKLIKTANLVFKTDDLARSRKSITHNLDHFGAYISNESLTESNYRNSQHITIQVPVNQFDKLVNKIGSGIEEFDTKEIDVTDVSSEFYDTKARITSKEKLETRMFEILKKAKTVKELLEIEYELSNIRTEIESMQGRLKYLTAKTSYSTINLEFYLEKELIETPKEEVNRFVEGFFNGWGLIVSFVLGLVYVWPFTIISIVLMFLIRRVMKKKAVSK